MVAQRMGADIVYIVSKNAVLGGPDNVAYGSAKAAQAHQVRLLAAELGPLGIRVNGVNPDGVVSGSGIFANGWGAERARIYGVPEAELGQFYASRTLLKREVLPENVPPMNFSVSNEPLLPQHRRNFDHAWETLAHADTIVDEVARFNVAAPSWAMGTGSTRFGRFPGGGEPRTIEEKLDDIAALNGCTGANRSVSLHVPWDDPADPAALREYAASLGIRFDAMNSNTFQDNPSTTRDGAISYARAQPCCHRPRRATRFHRDHGVAGGWDQSSRPGELHPAIRPRRRRAA
jgi:hypothetical protein